MNADHDHELSGQAGHTDTSIVVRAAARALAPVLVLVSFALLLRGHHEPGGGFAGGLVASAALVLVAVAFGPAAARRLLPCDPRLLIGLGLAVALASAVWSICLGMVPMSGVWVTIPGAGPLYKLGTPLLFDVGVWLLVIGSAAIYTLDLMEAPSATRQQSEAGP